MGMLSFLDREHTVAEPGFSRWMVPPAALCIHLCIGQAYAFSVFNLPMTKLIGITKSAPDDWKLTDLGWIFSIAIVLLGAFGRHPRPLGRGRRAAPRHVHRRAVLGRRLPHFGARRLCPQSLDHLSRAMECSAACGLGLGYISPVSTLIKWFPDRPGMATGMAIMGFGGGAFIASPLSVWLMAKFSTPTHVGVAETFIVLGVVYFVLHDGRRRDRARAGAGLEAGGLYAAGRRAKADHRATMSTSMTRSRRRSSG